MIFVMSIPVGQILILQTGLFTSFLTMLTLPLTER